MLLWKGLKVRKHFFKLKVIVSSFKFNQKAKAIAVATKFVTVLRMLYLVHKFTSVTAKFFSVE